MILVTRYFLNTRQLHQDSTQRTADNLAPEIHNDTVEVQPLSTKFNRVGLPVDENAKQFKLFVVSWMVTSRKLTWLFKYKNANI